MYQSFCSKLGFGHRSYSILEIKKDTKIILLSGQNSNQEYVIQRFKKIFKNKPLLYVIGKERFSENFLKSFQIKVKNKNPDILIGLGGGSIIDFTKKVYLKLNKKKLYMLPTLPGSGAETSITSIITTSEKKIFTFNDKFMPNGIIYDENLIKSCSKNLIIKGIIDAFCHCIEASVTINQNNYSNFLSNQTLIYFIKRNSIYSLKKNEKNKYMDICLLSFNGGLAQCNSGSGICHALAHAAEIMIKESHTRCISFFIIPVLNYYLKKNKKNMMNFNREIFRYIFKLVNIIKKTENFKNFEKLLSNNNQIEKLILNAKLDPCWKLYNGSINLNLLKKCLLNEKN